MKDIKTEFIMIAILTDKPSVGKEIGRIIGATKVRNGYVEGNGYMVTWTFGNMLRKRLHGYVDFREHAVTGHAEGLRNPEAGTE